MRKRLVDSFDGQNALVNAVRALGWDDWRKSLIMKGEKSYFESKPTTDLFIDAERTKVESNVVPITGFTL